MANVEVFASKDEIDETACLWVSRIDRGLSLDEKRELKRWVMANEAHRDSLEQMAALWDDMSVLNELSTMFPLEETRTKAPKWRFIGGIAASFLVGVLFMSEVPSWNQTSSDDVNSIVDQRSFVTQIGQNQSVTLSDGSVVQLNTNSRLTVSYTPEQRVITLHQGEAHFDVAHDVARPFTVNAGAHSVTAVGTAFNVQMQDESAFELLVTEGKVLIGDVTEALNAESLRAFSNGLTATGELMTAGEKAVVLASGPVMPELLSEVDVERDLAWQQGMLVFQGEPLSAALEEVSRYTDVRFTVSDELVGKHRVAGYFKAGDIDGLLATLKNNFDIDFYRTSPGAIVLTPSSS